MSEIEKLYRNAGIKADRVICYRGFDNCIDNDFNCHCHNETPCNDAVKIYSPFTAEKQLNLTKWLIQNKRLCIHKAEHSDNFYMDTATTRLNGVDNPSFEECLASMLNLIWQDLTEVEQEQIRRILNE